MARPVLAVDLDEVLGPFVRQFAAFLNEAEGTAFSEADFSSYYFSDCLPYTHDEVRRTARRDGAPGARRAARAERGGARSPERRR